MIGSLTYFFTFFLFLTPKLQLFTTDWIILIAWGFIISYTVFITAFMYSKITSKSFNFRCSTNAKITLKNYSFLFNPSFISVLISEVSILFKSYKNFTIGTTFFSSWLCIWSFINMSKILYSSMISDTTLIVCGCVLVLIMRFSMIFKAWLFFSIEF